MSYATQADLESRYPGELEQAGPKTADGLLDDTAVALALQAADAALDRSLRVMGWEVPLSAPIPGWVVALAVDLALYLATPTVLASQADFADRKTRYQAALDTLAAMVKGSLLSMPGSVSPASVAPDRLFTSTSLVGF